MKLRSSSVVFQVSDIPTTMAWYEEHLDFKSEGQFPPSGPPFTFGILSRDNIEIMLQQVTSAEPPLDTYRLRDGGCWHAYIRMSDIHAFYKHVTSKAVTILEPLKRQSYGDTEFVIRDPNGYVLVFSELIS